MHATFLEHVFHLEPTCLDLLSCHITSTCGIAVWGEIKNKFITKSVPLEVEMYCWLVRWTGKHSVHITGMGIDICKVV